MSVLLSVLQLLLLLLLFGHALHCNDAAVLVPISKYPANCIESERMALLDFKKHIQDPSNKLSSWVIGQDCCSWEGVHCDNLTGNILALELKGPDPNSYESYYWDDSNYLQLGGEISPSLLQLQHLNYLDLSCNFFDGTSIPSFISQFKELRYLNLSYSGFQGSIPAGFGNLSSLHTLDLSHNYGGVYVDDPAHQWLSHLSSLQHLVVSGVTFRSNSSSCLFLALNKLPSIKEIRLSQCGLESIPLFIPHLNFSSLSILDLSENYINFSVPSFQFNLKSLQYLDLRVNYFDNIGHDYQWLSNLTSLQHLDMSFVNLGNMSTSLFLALNKLPSINELHLSNCKLEKLPHSIPHLNFSSLSVLDLSYNHINFSGISWLFNIKSLQSLDLSQNELYHPTITVPSPIMYMTSIFIGPNYYKSQPSEISISIPESMGSLCSLQTLDLTSLSINKRLVELEGGFSGCLKNSLTHLHLSSTELKGDIPDWIGEIKNLKLLDLSRNSFSGSVPSSLASLSFLEELLLNDNQLTGTLPKEFGNLAQLVHLDLSYNQLSGAIAEEHFTQLGNLKTLDMSSNSPVFNVSANWVPPFLLNQLRIRSCLVGPEFPTWLQTQHMLKTLDMSQNRISSTVPDWLWNLTTRNLIYLGLSFNQIQGMIPKFLTFTHMEILDLSSNLFSGPLPNLHMKSPTFSSIDLSNNSFSGELLDCWSDSSTLSEINLAYNNISGPIPGSISHLSNLNFLLLNDNKLSGEFPDSLKNCSQLVTLDLRHNNFTGSIPAWIGERLSYLTVLMLKSNAFVNHIPQELSQLQYLQILDLSSNNLSGPIPKSLSNLTAMQMLPDTIGWILLVIQYKDTMLLSFRGRDDEYNQRNIGYLNYIDLSNNELSGNIPEELASLYALQSLNLSGNTLGGEIPNKLGRMKQLQSLDLSRNELSGSIPATLSNLTFLEHFNVSYNNLSGRIPSGNQFNTFNDSSIYIGNHLCGYPLSDNCTKDGGIITEELSDGKDEDDEMLWVYIGSLSGFAVGFWTIWGVLIFKKKWRHAYFHCVDNTYNKIYVFIAVSFARMRIKMMSVNH
ncbi:receptor-like protein EIX1 [Dioscorea cayenensis subsp. rotundata]|uniref:Receptor-like protein EIX1 n=1 Tax=Dioscorea cayennensis subsp. rotundata TaxID=55577 RepID=A0AB40C593_DIOCR|nr:receptor-like protein EIX1 [Dioscorea cayenensis subsp. rotundata]